MCKALLADLPRFGLCGGLLLLLLRRIHPLCAIWYRGCDPRTGGRPLTTRCVAQNYDFGLQSSQLLLLGLIIHRVCGLLANAGLLCNARNTKPTPIINCPPSLTFSSSSPALASTLVSLNTDWHMCAVWRLCQMLEVLQCLGVCIIHSGTCLLNVGDVRIL